MREKSVEIPLKSSPNLTYFKKYVSLYVSNTKFNLLILKLCLFIGLSDMRSNFIFWRKFQTWRERQRKAENCMRTRTKIIVFTIIKHN